MDNKIQVLHLLTAVKKYKINKIMEANRQYEYVIGIDLGHGETSAAICPLQWDNAPGELDAVKDLEMGGNKKVIPSAITILDDGRAYIGDAAFNPEVLKQANVRVCFKQAPKNINGDAEQIMIRYMQEVYRRIRENNSALLTDTNHLVYIATPSGWDVSTQNLYVEMARKAGIPMGGVTKESRAAFVKAQQDTTSGISRNIEKGAIVFDMGSSTLDFTYMNSSMSSLIDYGYDCGASFVEKSIFSEQEKEEEAIQLFEKKYPKLVDYLVFEARKVKEQVYFDPSLRVKKTINFDDIIDDEELEDERFKLMFKPGELNEFLDKNGYIKNIENAMLDYKKNHIPNHQIYGVFLTGGASRMDFIKPLVCKCWGVPEELVYRDQDPSLTISQGVAEVARMDMRTAGMDEGLGEEIDRLINSNDVYDLFVERYSCDYSEAAKEIVEDIFTSFKDDADDYCIAQLKSGISEGLVTFNKEAVGHISEYVQSSIMEKTENIRNCVECIIANYTAQGGKIDVDLSLNIDVSSINMPNIDLSSTLNRISKELISEDSGWGGAASGAAIGAAIGSVIPVIGTFFGGLIGGAIGKSATSTGDRETQALDQSTRIQIYNTFMSRWDGIFQNIRTSIRKSIMENTDIKDTIRNIVYTQLSSYKENLKNARILID